MKTHTKYFKYIQLFSKKVVAKKGKNCTQQSLKAIWVSSNQWILTIQINNFIQPTMPRSYYDFSQISLKSWGKRKKYQRYFRMLFYTFFPATFLKAAVYKVFMCSTRISSPEKSCKNTYGKIRYFFTPVWYRQSAADTSLAICATPSGWWMNGKAFAISIHGRLL